MRRLTPWGNSRDAMDDLQLIQNKIYEIRGQRVMLDRDLAEMYGVTTSALNQAVKRNAQRFPEEFMFQKLEITNCDIQFYYQRLTT